MILLGVLIVWPFAIVALLLLMNKLEDFVQRLDARTPEEAGIEPVAGASPEREVRIVVGDQVVGERPGPKARAAEADAQASDAAAS
jgi:hypothetical protein